MVGLDKGDIDFLQELGTFALIGDGIRFAIKMMWLYSITAIKAIKEKDVR